jgi:hypothetical protein
MKTLWLGLLFAAVALHLSLCRYSGIPSEHFHGCWYCRHGDVPGMAGLFGLALPFLIAEPAVSYRWPRLSGICLAVSALFVHWAFILYSGPDIDEIVPDLFFRRPNGSVDKAALFGLVAPALMIGIAIARFSRGNRNSATAPTPNPTPS